MNTSGGLGEPWRPRNTTPEQVKQQHKGIGLSRSFKSWIRPTLLALVLIVALLIIGTLFLGPVR